ncbi:MAG TPA: hypothetical protein VEV82_07240 [Actinomycetota bacterium]|nr:hypothetical protein [Actinomycetota bacterium]
MGSLILAFLLPSPATLAGGRPEPPRAILQVGGLRQEGRRGNFCWEYEQGAQCSLYTPRFRWPEAKTTDADQDARIKIRRWFEPETSRLHAYRHVDRDGRPTGDGWIVPHEVRQRTIDGRIRYFLYFHVTKKEGNYYLAFHMDLAEKNHESGDVTYFFHLDLK